MNILEIQENEKEQLTILANHFQHISPSTKEDEYINNVKHFSSMLPVRIKEILNY